MFTNSFFEINMASIINRANIHCYLSVGFLNLDNSLGRIFKFRQFFAIISTPWFLFLIYFSNRTIFYSEFFIIGANICLYAIYFV